MLAVVPTVGAKDLSAKAVMEDMDIKERFAYIAGVVEGIAYARFAADGKQTAGMNCIYDWFYKDPKSVDLIYAAFGQYPDFTAGAIIGALAQRKCG